MASSSMYPGKRITIYYQKNNPREVRYLDDNGWLILIFSGESRHGIVDHANLWPVSMYNNNLMTFFDQIA